MQLPMLFWMRKPLHCKPRCSDLPIEFRPLRSHSLGMYPTMLCNVSIRSDTDLVTSYITYKLTKYHRDGCTFWATAGRGGTECGLGSVGRVRHGREGRH